MGSTGLVIDNGQGGATNGQNDATAGLPKGALDPAAIAYYQAIAANQAAEAAKQSSNAAAVGATGIPLDPSFIAQLPPEIQLIFQDAINKAAQGQPLTQDAFQGELIKTNWWKSTPDTARQFAYQKIIDPATATQNSNQATFKVLQAAQQMGRPITLAQAAQLGESYIMGGWNDAMLNQHLATMPLGPHQTFGPGSLQTAMSQVKGTAANYGLPMSDLGAAGWAQKIAAGSMDLKGFEDYARQQAAASHPYWSKQLQEGATLRDLADPYIQQAAKTLELSPTQIDLTDPKWSNAWQTQDAKGATAPMSQFQWQQKLMTDQQYGYDHTQNALNAAYQMKDQLSKTFGFEGA